LPIPITLAIGFYCTTVQAVTKDKILTCIVIAELCLKLTQMLVNENISSASILATEAHKYVFASTAKFATASYPFCQTQDFDQNFSDDLSQTNS